MHIYGKHAIFIIEIKEDVIMIKTSPLIELRIFSKDAIDKIVSESEYKDDNERVELLKKWGVTEDSRNRRSSVRKE